MPTVQLAADAVTFGTDRWWIIVIKIVLAFVILMVFTLFNIWFERRVVARMQHRIGPNVNGPFGLLQSLADGVKLALKEDIIPTAADKAVFLLAPIIATVPAFVTFAVIPFGPTVTWAGHETPLQLTDMPVAVLFVMAVASVGIYGIVLGGWSSGSTYSLLGGLRSVTMEGWRWAELGRALLAIAIVALLLAFAAFVVIWMEGLAGMGAALTAMAVSLALLAYPAYLGTKAARLPWIYDITTDDAKDDESLRAVPGVVSLTRAGSEVTLTGRGEELISSVIECVSERRIRVRDFRTMMPTLEDVFLTLTGHSVRE